MPKTKYKGARFVDSMTDAERVKDDKLQKSAKMTTTKKLAKMHLDYHGPFPYIDPELKEIIKGVETSDLDKCTSCGKEIEAGQTALKRYYHPACDPKVGVLNNEQKYQDWFREFTLEMHAMGCSLPQDVGNVQEVVQAIKIRGYNQAIDDCIKLIEKK